MRTGKPGGKHVEGTGKATLVTGFHQEAGIEYGIQYRRGVGWSRANRMRS